MSKKLDERHLNAVLLTLRTLESYARERSVNHAALVLEDAFVTLGTGAALGLDIDAILRNVNDILTGDNRILDALAKNAIH